MGGNDLIQLLFQLHKRAGSDLDVRGLAFCAAMRLVDHYAGMFQGRTFTFYTGYQQYSAKRGGHTGTDRCHFRGNDLHGVINA